MSASVNRKPVLAIDLDDGLLRYVEPYDHTPNRLFMLTDPGAGLIQEQMDLIETWIDAKVRINQ